MLLALLAASCVGKSAAASHGALVKSAQIGKTSRSDCLGWPLGKSKDAMIADIVLIDLRYDRADLRSLLGYAKAHDVERGGRYEMRKLPFLNIWTHPWNNPGCKAESSLMFSLAFDGQSASLMFVALQPGYDWQVFFDELAILERAALGDAVYGKRQAEPIA